jgi:hypothetical protein
MFSGMVKQMVKQRINSNIKYDHNISKITGIVSVNRKIPGIVIDIFIFLLSFHFLSIR